MIKLDEDALICDLAEYYQIYDYRQLPPKMVAVFAYGLPNNSRIKLIASGLKLPLETMLLAHLVDVNALLLWAKTEDGSKGRNRPKSIYNLLINGEEEAEIVGFETGEEFEAARQKIIEKIKRQGGD